MPSETYYCAYGDVPCHKKIGRGSESQREGGRDRQREREIERDRDR